MLRIAPFSPSPPGSPPPLPTTLPGGPDAIANSAWPSIPTATTLASLPDGESHLQISRVENRQVGGLSDRTEAMVGVDARLPVETEPGAADDAVRSGQALAAAWQETLQVWTRQVALGLRMEASVHEGGADEAFARRCFKYDLETVVSSEELRRLLPLHAPLPQALRDAVLDAADVEILDRGPLDEAQIELANLALAEIYCQLEQPAAQALVEGKLGELFAALHARVRREWAEAESA